MKIIFYSDSPYLVTGMAKVIAQLGMYFQDCGHDVSYIGWHHNNSKVSKPVWLGDRTFNIIDIEKNNASIVDKLPKILASNNYDVVFCLGDIFNFIRLQEAKKTYYDIIKDTDIVPAIFIGYINVDSFDFTQSISDILNAFDHVITTSKFGSTELMRIPSRHKNIGYVHHGINLSIFNNTNDRSYVKKFTIVINSKNVKRKNIPVSLDAFREFSTNKDDVELILVTGIHDVSEGHHLKMFIDNYGINAKVRIVSGSDTFNGVNESDLNIIYNNSHVLLLSTSGEGFGLPLVEAMATGCVPVATECTSIPELLDKKRGLTIPVSAYLYGDYCQKLALVNPLDIVKLLDKLYNSWKKKDPYLVSLSRNSEDSKHIFSIENMTTKLHKEVEKALSARDNLSKISDSISSLYKYPVHPGIRIAITNRLKDFHSNILKIGVIKLGGYGDTLQSIPIMKGIKKKYPNSEIIAIVEKGAELFVNQGLVCGSIEVGNQHFNTVLKSVVDIFDITYDLRYVSKVFGEEENQYFNKYKSFYEGWAFSNNSIHILGSHVIDIMLKSSGLDEYATIDDMSITDTYMNADLRLPSKNYIIICNSTGNVGNLKSISNEEIEILSKWLVSNGNVLVQLGTIDDDPIPYVIDLRGKLSIQQTINVVNNSSGYIGIEGFLYHLARSLNIPRAVWFTCTPPTCFYYNDKNEISMTTGNCVYCWWNTVTKDKWWNTCYMGEDRCLNLPAIYDIIDYISPLEWINHV